MTIEAATYIGQLNPAYPESGDPKSEGDDVLRLIKQTSVNTFGNVKSAVNATGYDLDAVTGAATTGASIKVVTQPATDNSTNAASTAMVQAAMLASSGITAALPGQSGKASMSLITDGTSAAWGMSPSETIFCSQTFGVL